jgi:lipopolysaccharide transport system ATP-binding protein
MSDVALRTVGLGKMYHIGGERQAYRTLRDTIAQAAKRPIERIRHPGAATHTSEELWALRGLDLEVKQGEVLGVIGRNGSGKSTLLKVLSRITEPTEGRVEIKGRVSSLLEVGTGFHPELTGRENIQLNGAILGMTRAEIKSKFDEIVEFSEIARFLDTPVKRYSSGMYIRLAFAVAAHLESDILAVDEVLAVGDAAFQRKCLGRMDDVRRQGRTLLFVSHNLQAIRSLCGRCAWLDAGRLRFTGKTQEVVTKYLADGMVGSAEVEFPPDATERTTDIVRLRRVALQRAGTPATAFRISEPLDVVVEYGALTDSTVLYPGIQVRDEFGGVVFVSIDYPSTVSAPDPIGQRPRRRGIFRSTVRVPGELLNAGAYTIDVGIADERIEWQQLAADAVLRFEILDDGVYGVEHRGGWAGSVRPRLSWKTERLGS